MACELGSRFHIGNLIKKHIYLRNKSIKDVADYLGMSEKTFSDHIGSYEIKSDELFKLANYLEISLDYINDIFNGNCSLYGLMVFRLSKLQHIIAHDIVESHISKIKVYAGNDITYIIDELRKTFKGLGYVIDALLPLECEDNVSYRLYVNESNDRGNINSGEFIIFPPYGKSQDVFNYNEYLKGQSGKEFLKIYLKEHFENSSYNQADYLEAIHSNYNDITENDVKRFWNGRFTIKNSVGDIIASKQFGPGLYGGCRRVHFSRAEYFYIKGMLNIDKGNYCVALKDFNTALYVYHNDWMFDYVVYGGRRRKGHYDKFWISRGECFELDNVFPKTDAYLGKIKVLQILGEYGYSINILKEMLDSKEFKDFYLNTDDEFLARKALINAYFKSGEREKALVECQYIKDNISFKYQNGISFIKSMICETKEQFVEATVNRICFYYELDDKCLEEKMYILNRILENLDRELRSLLKGGRCEEVLHFCCILEWFLGNIQSETFKILGFAKEEVFNKVLHQKHMMLELMKNYELQNS